MDREEVNCDVVSGRGGVSATYPAPAGRLTVGEELLAALDPEGVGEEVGATGGSGGMSPEELRRVEVLRRKIKDHRERHSLIQEEFAQECGLSRSIIARIEGGARLPGKRSRRKIADALGIPVEELFEPPREERG